MVSSIHSINCEKWEGAGNDFIIVEDLALSPNQIQQICHRQHGVGADGVIVATKQSGVLCRMRIFNADGSEAEMCGNGLRALFAYGGWDRGEIAVGNERYLCWKSKSGISTKLGKPKILEEGPGYLLIDTGVPHAVLFEDLEIKTLRERLNANVTWFENGRVHTFERGVEAVTLACGTGIAAAHFALHHKQKAKIQEMILSSGGTLFTSRLEMDRDKVAYITLEAPARKVFSGKVFLECATICLRQNSEKAINENRDPKRSQKSRV